MIKVKVMAGFLQSSLKLRNLLNTNGFLKQLTQTPAMVLTLIMSLQSGEHQIQALRSVGHLRPRWTFEPRPKWPSATWDQRPLGLSHRIYSNSLLRICTPKLTGRSKNHTFLTQYWVYIFLVLSEFAISHVLYKF